MRDTALLKNISLSLEAKRFVERAGMRLRIQPNRVLPLLFRIIEHRFHQPTADTAPAKRFKHSQSSDFAVWGHTRTAERHVMFVPCNEVSTHRIEIINLFGFRHALLSNKHHETNTFARMLQCFPITGFDVNLHIGFPNKIQALPAYTDKAC